MNVTPSLDLLVRAAEAEFARRVGRPPGWVAAAPGRVNLIGEHTDYNDGFVLPMAIDRYAVLAADPAPAGAGIRLHSTAYDGTAVIPLDGAPAADLPGWAKYVQGVVAGFRAAGAAPGPFEALIHSDVPLGGGLSSSAALEVAAATLLEGLTGRRLDPLPKALLCQRAEHDYAGVPCGIMDQCASVMGRAGALLLLDCRSRKVEYTTLADPDVHALIVNSNVRHALTDGGYATRRQQCEAAARLLGVRALRDVTADDVDRARDSLGDLLHRRARHVVTENARTVAAADAVRRGAWDDIGPLMAASHASLRDDFEVSCPELDLLVDLAAAAGPARGVLGSRMTGGGFGGCTITLVRAAAADAVRQQICDEYRRQAGREATAFTTPPVDGARLLKSPAEHWSPPPERTMKPNDDPADAQIRQTGVTNTPPADRPADRPGQSHSTELESEHGKPTGGPGSEAASPPLTATTTQPGAAQREDQSGA